MSWGTSKLWLPHDEVDETNMNEQVRDKNNWLYDRYHEAITNDPTQADGSDTTDYSPAGATKNTHWKSMVAFTQLTLTEETVLQVLWNGMIATAAARVYVMDVMLSLNGGAYYYYTSGTTTKPTTCHRGNLETAAIQHQTNFDERITLGAGNWTVEIGLWTLVNTGTLTTVNLNYRTLGLLRVLY